MHADNLYLMGSSLMIANELYRRALNYETEGINKGLIS